MASLGDLVVRLGADTSQFKTAFLDAVELLESAESRATSAGGAISRAFEKLGVSDTGAKLAAQAKQMQSAFELLDRAFQAGRISADDYAKAQEGLRQKLEALGGVKIPVEQFERLGESLKALGIDKSKFQIDQEIAKLNEHLSLLDRAFKAGKISSDEFATAQGNVKKQIEGLTAIPVDKFERIGEAFKALKIDKSQFQVGQEIAKLQQELEYLDRALKAGKISAADYALAQKSVKAELDRLNSTKLPAEEIQKLSAAFKSLGIDKSQFQVGNEIDKLTADLAELEKAYKAGTISSSDFAKAQKAVDTEIRKLQVSDVTDKLKKLDTVSRGMRDVGGILTAAFTLPLAGAGIAVTKFAADFDLEMRKVTSLLGGATEQEFKQLSAATLELSQSMGIDAVKSAQALYEALSAGVPKENALSFIEVASKAAIAGITDTKVVVDALTTVIAAYGLQASDAKAISDTMFQAVNVGKFQFADLAASIGPAAQQAKNLGVSYQELMAATATLSITSGGVSEAVTQVQSAMRALLDPTKEMVVALEAVGFNSGSAAVKALGLEGTLEALRKQTGDNAEAFNALFGRLEASTAAVGLTGDKARKAATDLEVMRHATDGAGASTKAFEEIQKSSSRQFEIAKAELKNIAIEMGTSLLPAVNSLLQTSKPLIDFLSDAVKWFVALPEPVRNTALAFAGLAAVIGPFLYGASSIVTAFTTIANSAIGLSGAIAGSAGLKAALGAAGISGALATATPLVVAFGVAIAGIGAYKAVTEIRALADEVEASADRIRLLGEATNVQRQEIGILEDVLRNHKITLDSTGQSVDQYIAALKKSVSGIDEFKGKQLESTQALKDGKINILETAKAALGFGRAQEEVAAAVKTGVEESRKKHEADLRELEVAKETLKSLKEMKASKAELAAATERVTLAARKLHPELKATGDAAGTAGGKVKDAAKQLQEAFDKLGVKGTTEDVHDLYAAFALIEKAFASGKIGAEEFAKAQKGLNDALDKANGYDPKWVDEYNQKLQELNRNIEKSSFEVSVTMAKAHEKMREDSVKEIEVLNKQWQKIPILVGGAVTEIVVQVDRIPKSVQDALKKSEDATKKLEDAFKRVGLASIPELERAAKEAQKDFEIIRDSGKASAEAVLAAELRAIKAGIEARRAKGETITREEEKQLEKIEDALEKSTGKQKGTWSDMARQVSTIMSDLGKDISEAIIGIFKRNPENDRLAEESQELRTSLEQRTQEWEQYQADTVASLDKIRQKHADDLREQENDLGDSLSERRAAYEESVADIQGQIGAVRQKHAEELDGEITDIKQAYSEKEDAFNEYQREVLERIGEIRGAHAQQQEDELKDLRTSLRDRTEDYDDFVEDIQQKLGNLSFDITEDISDENRSTDRKIADKQKDLKREEEDTKKKIARLLAENKKGNQQEIADLQKKLKEKQEDTEEYIRREREDLEEFINDKKRMQEREESQLRESLDRRTRDHKQFLDENNNRQIEVVNKHKAAVEKQVGDLQESLETRKGDLEKFKLESIAKIQTLTTTHQQEMEKEIGILQEGLKKKALEWDKYQNEINKKLAELRENSRIELEIDEAQVATDLATAKQAFDQFKIDTDIRLAEIEQSFTGVWDRVSGAFGTMLESMGTAILRFGTEKLTDKLFKWFKKDFGDILIDLGEKLLDIFGLAGGVVDKITSVKVPDWVYGVGDIPGGGSSSGRGGSVPSIPTGGGGGGTSGGGGGSSVGGALGVVNAITGVATAISSVFGNFQMAAMNKVLDLIEVQVRRGAQYLGDRADGGIVSAVLRSKEYLDYIRATTDTLGVKLDSWLEPLPGKLDTIIDQINRIIDGIGGVRVETDTDIESDLPNLPKPETEDVEPKIIVKESAVVVPKSETPDLVANIHAVLKSFSDASSRHLIAIQGQLTALDSLSWLKQLQGIQETLKQVLANLQAAQPVVSDNTSIITKLQEQIESLRDISESTDKVRKSALKLELLDSLDLLDDIHQKLEAYAIEFQKLLSESSGISSKLDQLGLLNHLEQLQGIDASISENTVELLAIREVEERIERGVNSLMVLADVPQRLSDIHSKVSELAGVLSEISASTASSDKKLDQLEPIEEAVSSLKEHLSSIDESANNIEVEISKLELLSQLSQLRDINTATLANGTALQSIVANTGDTVAKLGEIAAKIQKAEAPAPVPAAPEPSVPEPTAPEAPSPAPAPGPSPGPVKPVPVPAPSPTPREPLPVPAPIPAPRSPLPPISPIPPIGPIPTPGPIPPITVRLTKEVDRELSSKVESSTDDGLNVVESLLQEISRKWTDGIQYLGELIGKGLVSLTEGGPKTDEKLGSILTQFNADNSRELAGMREQLGHLVDPYAVQMQAMMKEYTSLPWKSVLDGVASNKSTRSITVVVHNEMDGRAIGDAVIRKIEDAGFPVV
jgi:TP901 family phage tail tape measure protein